MVDSPATPGGADNAPNPAAGLEATLLQLRRKQGGWLDWGRACQQLQQAGLTSQKIFEETGFEPIHQNQLVVATQVYASLEKENPGEAVQAHFAQRGSDVLYELRILSHQDRARAAALALDQGLDADSIRDIAKALKEYSYLKELPRPFTEATGDGVAYHYWKLARQQSDLQVRSRLIAQGLRFVASIPARQQLEKLLTDFAVVKSRSAPTLPVYRLESDSELPCLIPIAGAWPLTPDAIQAVPVMVPEEPFGIVHFSGTGAWAPIPGWQVILQAEDPIGILAPGSQLGVMGDRVSAETLLVVVDRGRRQWDEHSYFLAAAGEQVTLQWFETEPSDKLLGRLVLVLRPKRILDENYTRELYQFEE